MFDVKTVIAIVLSGLMCQHQALAGTDSSKYFDQSSGHYYHHDIHRLFTDLKESDKIFTSRNSLFKPYVVTDDSEIRDLFSRRARGLDAPSQKGELEFSSSFWTIET